ncbi:MAG: hypothetical protein L0Z50_39680 [Verrucomicrobiales bacterium]|nr:hypothetical protein [Verrucomicrobiales bacterium]
MSFRNYILENLRWKVAALLLAVLVWISIQWAMRKGFGDWRAQTLRNQPVLALTAPHDLRAFRIEPAAVDVVLRPRAGAFKSLTEQPVQVFVNLTDIPEVTALIREVLVFTQGQHEVLRTEPKAVSVYVEGIGGLRSILTNSVIKP